MTGPKLIIKVNYFSKDKKKHVTNYEKYIALREGVEIIYERKDDEMLTASETNNINRILKHRDNISDFQEYQDYLAQPTVGNFRNLFDLIGRMDDDVLFSPDLYLKYASHRPGTEKDGDHGLFDQYGKADLNKHIEDMMNTNSIIYRSYISMTRTEAERMGMDSAKSWQKILSRNYLGLCKALGIPEGKLIWNGAFHDEGDHPHCHFTFYSQDPKYGYINRNTLKQIKSQLTRAIYKEEFVNDLKVKQEQREILKGKFSEELETARGKAISMIGKYFLSNPSNQVIVDDILRIAETYKISGRSYYQYQRPELKAEIDSVVEKIFDLRDLQPLLKAYYQSQCNIDQYYHYEDKNITFDQFKDRLVHPQHGDRKTLSNDLLNSIADIQAHINLNRIRDVSISPKDIEKAKERYGEQTVDSALLRISQYSKHAGNERESDILPEGRISSQEAKVLRTFLHNNSIRDHETSNSKFASYRLQGCLRTFISYIHEKTSYNGYEATMYHAMVRKDQIRQFLSKIEDAKEKADI